MEKFIFEFIFEKKIHIEVIFFNFPNNVFSCKHLPKPSKFLKL